jgi:hypothetical protein
VREERAFQVNPAYFPSLLFPSSTNTSEQQHASDEKKGKGGEQTYEFMI